MSKSSSTAAVMEGSPDGRPLFKDGCSSLKVKEGERLLVVDATALCRQIGEGAVHEEHLRTALFVFMDTSEGVQKACSVKGLMRDHFTKPQANAVHALLNEAFTSAASEGRLHFVPAITIAPWNYEDNKPAWEAMVSLLESKGIPVGTCRNRGEHPPYHKCAYSPSMLMIVTGKYGRVEGRDGQRWVIVHQ